MSGEVFMKLTADERQMVEAWRRLTDAEKKAKDEAKKVKEEHEKLGAEAKKILNSMMTDQEKVNAKLAVAKKAVEANKLELKDYEKYAKKLNDELNKTGQAQEKAFGNEVLSNITSLLGGLSLISTAENAITGALQEQVELREQARQINLKAAGGEALLAQVADNREHFQQLKLDAKNMFLAGAGDSQEQAASMLFALRSANVTSKSDIALATEAVASRFEPNLEALASGFNAMTSTIGLKETGGFEALFNKAVLAGAVAEGTAAQVMQATAKSGESAKSMGLSDEITMAMTAFATKGLGPDTGPTAINSFLNQLVQNPEFRGRPMKDVVAQLSSMSIDDRLSVITDSLAQKGYGVVAENFPAISQLEKSLETGNTQAVVRERLGWLREDQQLSAASLDRQRSANFAATLRDGGIESILAAANSDIAAAQVGRSPLARITSRLGAQAMDMLYSPDDRLYQHVTRPETRVMLSPDTFAAAVAELVEIKHLSARSAEIFEKHYQATQSAEQRKRPAAPTQKPDAE